MSPQTCPYKNWLQYRPVMLNHSSSPLLEVHGLRCERGDRTLFSDLSFQVQGGQLLQIEGANGSGKTTLLRTLCGLFQPIAGNVTWRGQAVTSDPVSYHTELTYIGHLPGIKFDLTAVENLSFIQGMQGKKPDKQGIFTALDKIGLYGFEEIPCRFLSAGQKRRVALARLLLQPTALWILDEPFTALDRAGNALLSDMLAQQLSRGGMVVLTSHQPVVIADVTLTRLALE